MLLKGMRNQFFERKTSRAERNARTAQPGRRGADATRERRPDGPDSSTVSFPL